MNRLRTRLIAAFILATALPLGLTLWTTVGLVDSSLDWAPLDELGRVTQSLEETAQELYRQSRESLRRDIAEGRIEPQVAGDGVLSPDEQEAFALGGANGDVLHYYQRQADGTVLDYSRQLKVSLKSVQARIAEGRHAVDLPEARDVRAGFSRTLILVAAALWLAALGGMIFLAERISRPVRQLTQGLGRVAAGDLSTRVEAGGSGEIGEAVVAFNHMAAQSEQARERLIQVTQLASWQALARKMAHEVKNSLTPIRLTVEEMVSRGAANGQPDAFMEQAAQIVTEEVTSLEKRVRAFSEFAAEPPVTLDDIDVNAMIEERVAFLRTGNSGVGYEVELDETGPHAVADRDLVKGVLTNLLENAAQAARIEQAANVGASPNGTGRVRVRSGIVDGQLRIEVEDSGPGLSEQARASLFEPTISFKKGGMGLGLSIARRSAVLCGGDLQTFDGALGGAGFRLTLPLAASGGAHSSRRNGTRNGHGE